MRKMAYIYKSQSRDESTVYLYDKTIKTILPIQYERAREDSLRGTFIKTILHILNGNPKAVEIYLFQSDRYYTYLHIKNNSNEAYKINCGIRDALFLAKSMNLPIFAGDNVLQRCGIKITKELLYNSMGLHTPENTVF